LKSIVFNVSLIEPVPTTFEHQTTPIRNSMRHSKSRLPSR